MDCRFVSFEENSGAPYSDLVVVEDQFLFLSGLVSEDLDEIFQLSDRVAVMYEGTFMGILPVGEVGLEQIGMAMAGAARLGGEA